jgi:hypothetical protein
MPRPDLALDARARLVQHAGRFAPLPDAAVAAIFAAGALMDFFPAALPAGVLQARDELVFGLIVEGGFLMMQGTLVDIATRLRRRPPVWLVAVILAAVVVFSGQSMDVLRLAWRRGSIVFIPLVISLLERATILWRLPDRAPIEKMAARALIGNRITTGLALFAAVTAAMLFGFADKPWVMLGAGALYFAVAAFDGWRVRGRGFREHPRVLFGFDPLGVKYLAPL